jgi:ubiquitin-protein ligase
MPKFDYRISKEIEEFHVENIPNCILYQHEASVRRIYLEYMLQEGWGAKKLTFEFFMGDKYPFTPPTITCKTPHNISHPQIDAKTGNFSMSILREGWYPTIHLITVIERMVAVLETPVTILKRKSHTE